VFPEISAIAFDDDRKILCIGTTQLTAKVIIWEICSRTKLKDLEL